MLVAVVVWFKARAAFCDLILCQDLGQHIRDQVDLLRGEVVDQRGLDASDQTHAIIFGHKNNLL